MKKLIILTILTTSCSIQQVIDSEDIPQKNTVMHYVDGILVSSECENCDEVD